MSQEALLQRLEAAVARLEKLGVAGGKAAAAAAGDDDEVSPQVEGFQQLQQEQFAPLLASFDAFPELAEHKAKLAAAIDNQLALVRAIGLAKKPSDQELLAFLQPSADAIGFCSNLNYKSAVLEHQQALADAAPFLSWPFAKPGYKAVEGNRDSAQMYLNRILVKAKDLPEAEKAAARAFAATIKSALTAYAEFLKEHYKQGIDWNPNGVALAEVGGAAPAAKPAAAAAPVAAAKPVVAAAPAPVKGNVFAELNKGLNITSGLRAVTDDMKTKNRDPKDVSAVVPAPKAKPVAKAEPVAAKPASLVKQGDSWYCEWQWNQNEVKIENLTISQGAYIGNCRNANVYITGKPKSINVDKCFRTNVFIDGEVLSSVEIINSDRVTIYAQGVGTNTYAIDKSKGCIVNLSAAAQAVKPAFITSNISECNIQVPGRNPDEDIIEAAIPEQYTHKLANDAKGNVYVTAEPVSHG